MSSIFESFLATPEVTEVLSDHNFIAAMLQFEAALARAQAQLGVIPQAAAHSIIGTCKVDLFDVPKLVRESGRERCLASPLIASLRETVGLFNPDATGFIHYGCSNQDVIDSAMALLTRQVLVLIQADVASARDTLLGLAQQHAGDPVLARTPWQPAAVSSLGWTFAQWAAPLQRSHQRLDACAEAALAVQLGGALGTQAELRAQGAPVAALVAAELQLRAPAFAWHRQRDDWVALGSELGLLVGNLGRIAKEISLLSQPEVGEFGPADHALQVALVAAQRVPQCVATLIHGLSQDCEPGLGHWLTGLVEWPVLLRSTHAAARSVALALGRLQLNPRRMRSNLETRRASLGSKASADWFSPALAEHAAETTRRQVAALQAAGASDSPA